MNRRAKILITATTLIALPLQVAFAETVDDQPTVDGTSPDGQPPAVPVATVSDGVASPAIIDRALVVRKDGIAAHADLLILHTSVTIADMTVGGTSEAMTLGAGYGVTDTITAGAMYSFTLNEFEIKGPLTVYGATSLTDNGTLAVSAGADLGVNFASDNSLAIHAGLAVRYKVAPTVAIYTGNPYTPGPAGQHLSISLDDGGPKTFSFPVGVAVQATPQLYAFAQTNLATILLSDPAGGDRVTFIGDSIPLSLGAFFNVNRNIDAGGSFQTDLRGIGDYYVITLGARYYQ